MFTSTLQIEKVDCEKYRLVRSLVATMPPKLASISQVGRLAVRIPEGFTCDGASIPRLFWRVIGSPWTGRYTRAAVLHDFLYRRQFCGRKAADKAFLVAMQVEGVSWWKRRLIYYAVRWGGQPAWDERSIK